MSKSVRDQIQPGDRVAYANVFLRNTGQWGYDAAERRATVVAVGQLIRKPNLRLLEVQWDDESEPTGVLNCNVWPADKIHLEPR